METTRAGICAVGYLTVSAQDYVKDPKRPYFKVIGTGFLVRPTTVITNRHVIEKLETEQADFGFPDDQKLLTFVYPIGPGKWQSGSCIVRATSISTDPRLDVGFIEFNRRPDPDFAKCQPLQFGGLATAIVGHPIAACGYPYGTAMLTKEGRVYRFGPVLQQGYISALSPFDKAGTIDELLLDLRAAPGMSGSPVFFPGDGGVIGIIYATWEATTAVAIPLDAQNVKVWLSEHDNWLAKSPPKP